jgi:N4-gp56 family major capsid protein
VAGQLWAQNEYGGYWSNQELSLDMHIQAQPIMRFRQFCDRDSSFGANRGDTLLFNKFLNVDTEGGPLDENLPFPKTGFKTNQSAAIATEYGNSIPYTEKLERLSKFDTQNAHNRAIINDVGKVLNRGAATEFRRTRVKATPVGTAGTPTVKFELRAASDVLCSTAATRAAQVEDILCVIEAMKSGVYTSSDTGTTVATLSPVPPYDDDGNYICVCSVGFASSIWRDSDFINAALYGDPERLFAGEIGRFHGVRFIEDNHILNNTITGFRGEAVFFGAEAVKEIVVLMEEIRRGVPMDGGRDRSFYWYAILGFKLIWEAHATNEPDNRIVHFTSSSITA